MQDIWYILKVCFHCGVKPHKWKSARDLCTVSSVSVPSEIPERFGVRETHSNKNCNRTMTMISIYLYNQLQSHLEITVLNFSIFSNVTVFFWTWNTCIIYKPDTVLRESRVTKLMTSSIKFFCRRYSYCKFEFHTMSGSWRDWLFPSKAMSLTLSWRTSLSYRNRSIDLFSKWMDWFLYYRDLTMKELNCK